MRLKTFCLLFLFSFLVACQTTTVGLSPKEKNYLQAIIEHNCFFNSTGDFVAVVSSSRFPSVNWEGKWVQNFDSLSTQLVDPTGRTLKNTPFDQIQDKFGPKGLRSVMCGQFAFERSLKIENHNIKMKSLIKPVYYKNDDTTLETTTEFYYGLFGKKSQITLMWKGNIKDGNVMPLSIKFGSADETVYIKFLEYK